MNKHLKTALATFLTVALLAGCSPSSESVSTIDNKDTTDSETVVQTEVDDDQDTSEPESQTEDEDTHAFIQLFSEFMTSDPSAVEIASFMEDNLDLSRPDEASMVLSRLLIAQSQIRYDWFDMISDDRLTGFQNMNNQWRLENIELIEDETTKAKYESLRDSYLRIVTYEENPVVETDWARLQTFSEYFSESVNLMIELNRKVQNYEYGAYPHDFAAMADDVLTLEEAIYNRSSDFITSQMNKTYTQLISEMFYSTEGINMEYWRDLDSPLLVVLRDVAEKHGETEFGKLCIKFVDGVKSADSKDSIMNQVSDIVPSHNMFGLHSSLSVEMESVSTDTLSRNIELLNMPHNKTAEEKINTAIKQWFQATERDYGWSEDSDFKISEDSFGSFVVGNYYGVTLYTSKIDTNGQYESTQTNALFDLKTGASVTLESFLDSQHSRYAPVLLKSIKKNYSDQYDFIKDLDSLPENMTFTLNEYGIILSFNKHELTKDYDYALSFTVPYDELYEIFDVMSLY